MDTYFEQIVKIKKTSKVYMSYALISLLAVAVITVGIMFLRSFWFIAAVVAFWGALKLYSMLDVEYEYIITNSSCDIDKIIAKSSRKRIFSFDLSSIERIEKYRKDLPEEIIKDAFFACNTTDEDALVVIIHPEGKEKKTVVFAPNERMRSAIKKYVPKFIGENL